MRDANKWKHEVKLEESYIACMWMVSVAARDGKRFVTGTGFTSPIECGSGGVANIIVVATESVVGFVPNVWEDASRKCVSTRALKQECKARCVLWVP